MVTLGKKITFLQCRNNSIKRTVFLLEEFIVTKKSFKWTNTFLHHFYKKWLYLWILLFFSVYYFEFLTIHGVLMS